MPDERKVFRLIPSLKAPRSLSAADRAFLQRQAPLPLPLDLAHTVALHDPSLSGRYWLAPGAVGAQHRPGACLYEEPVRGKGVGAACFDLETVAAARALQVVSSPGAPGADVVGVLPRAFLLSSTAVSVALPQHSKRLAAHRRGGFYSLHLARPPRAVNIRAGRRHRLIVLDGG